MEENHGLSCTMKRDTKIYLILGIIIIAIIIGIYLIKKPAPITDEETIKCIAQNSIVYSSKTCSACDYQKDLFGDHYNLINEIECTKEPQKCLDAGVSGTPTWIINNKKYPGARQIKDLKELTGC